MAPVLLCALNTRANRLYKQSPKQVGAPQKENSLPREAEKHSEVMP